MSLSSKLCNPTPFRVELPWHLGINIHVEPFGAAELTMQQMDDFRPGKPGSADVKGVLDYHGVFVLDTDRPYDNQALEALKRSRKAKKEQYDAAVQRLVDRRAQTGIAPNEEAFEDTLKKMGYVELRNKIQQLDAAIRKFQDVVGDRQERSARPQLDPKRTIFVLDPPREFPSVASMEFFLDQNPEVKAKHEAFKSQARASTVKEVVDPAQQTLPEFEEEDRKFQVGDRKF